MGHTTCIEDEELASCEGCGRDSREDPRRESALSEDLHNKHRSSISIMSASATHMTRCHTGLRLAVRGMHVCWYVECSTVPRAGVPPARHKMSTAC
jgi:hypothetical protein